MKHLNKFLSGMLLVFGLGSGIFPDAIWAQPDLRRALPDSADIVKMVEMMGKRLLLSDSVKIRVQRIYLDSYRQLRLEIERNAGDMRGMQKSMRQIMQTRDQQVKSYLSDRQKKEYDRFVQEQRQQFREQMKKRRQRMERPPRSK